MAGGKFPKPKQRRTLTLDKRKGQHMLTDKHTIEKIVQKSGIKSTDTILEIGPGTGNLTRKLLEFGKSVVAIEIDERMVGELKGQLRNSPFFDRLTIIHGDVLKCELPYFDICVANIPYQISSCLVFKLLAHKFPFRCAVLMFQREFAFRLTAQPGDKLYCRLSVNTQLLARVSHLLKVSKKGFDPPPKVDSCIVRIEPRKTLPLPAEKLREWNGLLSICFSRKNKTLGAIFKQKKVLALLKKNYNTLQAFSQTRISSQEMDIAALGETFEDLTLADEGEGDHGDDEMEMDDSDTEAMADVVENNSGFKEKVMGVLKQYDYETRRSSKFTQNEFIHLLSVFNEAHIHFA